MVLNMPMIGIWVKLLAIPYRYLYPSALFFVCIGVYSIRNDMFAVGTTLAIGMFGHVLLRHGFHPAPILLGFVLGQRFEENLRRAFLLSRGDATVFLTQPSAWHPDVSVLLIGGQIYLAMRRRKPRIALPSSPSPILEE